MMDINDLKKEVELPEGYKNRLTSRIVSLSVHNGMPFHVATPGRVLALGIAEFLYNVMPFTEEEGSSLVAEMWPSITLAADELHKLWRTGDAEAEVPSYAVSFASHQYVTWYEMDQFYHPVTGNYVKQLPLKPIFFTSLHLGAVYFNLMGRLTPPAVTEDKDAESPAETP